MRKIEKLIVLAVLFTAAIVLAFAVNRKGDEVEASDPLGGLDGVLEDEQGPATPADDEVARREDPPSLLLDAGTAPPAPASVLPPPTDAVEQSGATLALEPASDPTARILTDTAGLRPSFLENYMVYRVTEGDTWSALAQRFYQDGRFTRNLHLANEELVDLTPGEEILVPVYDFIAVDAGLQRGSGSDAETAVAPAPATAATFAASADAQPGAGTAAPRSITTRTAESTRTVEYEVQPGDTLSEIAQAVLGGASRWPELIELNRDKLDKPESLRVGMKLRVPEGARVPAAGTAKVETKKPAPKPTTAKTTEKAPAKSKKVL